MYNTFEAGILYIKIILRKLFVDKDLLNTTINNILRLISNPLILVFIPLFLTPQLQGFWFSFISIASLSIFADLGFTNLILQFTAHEFAFLSFDGKVIKVSNEEGTIHLDKLASLLKFTLKWILIVAIVVFPLIFFVGIKLFAVNAKGVIWILPWAIYIAGSTITFISNVILSFIEGCNQVARIQYIRSINAVFFSILILITLALGFNLFSLALALALSSIFSIISILFYYKSFISQLLEISLKTCYNWKSEIFKLLWKYAISFGCGYFIFQIYTPMAFKYYGPEEAGKIGLSIAIWMACFSIANIWLISVLPKMNMLIELKQWHKLDTLFQQRVILGSITYFILVLTILIFYFIFKDFAFLKSRLMTIPNLLLLSLFWQIQFLIGAWAFYLRAHKEEPYVITSFVSAIYIVLITFFILRNMDASYILFGLYSSAIIFTPWNYLIFRHKMKKWHVKMF